MSNANIEIVKRIYACFHAGDLNGLLEYFAEDVTWDHRGLGAPDSPKNKLFHGKDGVQVFFKTVGHTQEVLEHGVTDYVASSDQVVAIGFFRARVKATGKEVASDWAQVWTVKDGLITAWKAYADFTADAIAFQT